MGPAGLHHADLRIGKVMNGLEQKVRWRNEVGVENSNELAFRGFQTFMQRAGFESGAVRTMQVSDRKSL